jgi:hypothetical protein
VVNSHPHGPVHRKVGRDGSTRISVDAQVVGQFEGSTPFANLEEASKFFQKDSAGHSVTGDRHRLDGSGGCATRA